MTVKTNPSLPGQLQTFGYLLRTLYESLQLRVYAAVAEAGHPEVRRAHSSVLRRLDPEGSRVADLAKQCGLTKQSVTYLVADLERLGYLAIKPDPDDRRAKLVKFTAKGRQLSDVLVRETRRVEKEMAKQIGTAKLEDLRSSLNTLIEHFDAL